jgi:hypothetical protein
MFGKKKIPPMSLLALALRSACDEEDEQGLKGWISTRRVRDILNAHAKKDF